MAFETFKQTVRDSLSVQLGPEYLLTFHSITKNNGIMLDGLCITPSFQTAAPAIYLNSYYDDFCHGVPMEQIVEEILAEYLEHSQSPPVSAEEFLDFSVTGKKVIYRLVHTASNQSLLSGVPHLPFLDLSVIFYALIDKNDSRQMSALITNRHMTLWHTTAEELYDLASVNTPRLLPASICSMDAVLRDLIQKSSTDFIADQVSLQLLHLSQAPSPLFILSNQSGLFGAACILYKNVLKNFAKLLKGDLIILPSSVHEVILLKNDENTCYNDWCQLVTSINRQEVPPEDQLSNQVYLYSAEHDEISVISYSCEPVGLQNPQ